MKIPYAVTYMECLGFWDTKREMVIFVADEADRKKLHKLLIKYDADWKDHPELIQIAPYVFKDKAHADSFCSYTHKCVMPNIAELKKKVNFIIYKKYPDNEC